MRGREHFTIVYDAAGNVTSDSFTDVATHKLLHSTSLLDQTKRGPAHMSNHIQLGDVHTYYEEDGSGDALVLLHPGLADSRAFEEYMPELAQHFHVFRPDRRGHGRTPDVEGPITYEQMARDTIAFLEQVVGSPAFLLGHSDGR